MAATPSFSSSSSASSSLMSYLLGFSVFLTLFLSSLEKGFAVEENQLLHQHAHTVELNSLLPATSCSPSSSVKGHDNKEPTSSSTVLKVVHKHGPCSGIKKNKSKIPTHAQILNQDQARVDSIHSRVNTKKSPSAATVDKLRPSAETKIPAQSGSVVGSGNYIVSVGLGSPKKMLSLIFDTGSDLTWTQCRPCAKSCYKQKEPIFDPATSSSYVNISCSSATCSELVSGTGNTPGCASSTCVYGIQYGDQSFSVGFFGKERLSLTPTDIFDGFLFGCGQNNQGLFGGAAGLLGLGRDKISIIEQSALKYNRFFSYCLPSKSSATGYLSFGKGGGSSGAVKFTPLSDVSQGGSFYGLDVVGISVGGKKLPISGTIFSSSGTIIDSGTVITRLPPTAYKALRDAFQQGMKSYPSAPALSILDTCYDFSKADTVTFPKISFEFGGRTTLELDPTGIFYVASADQVCLAFAANGDDSDIGIFGNVQQKRVQVVYDVAGGKIGFAPAGCP